MKRTTTYGVTVYDIANNGDYVNPRGDVYISWKEALQAYKHAKWYRSQDTLVELDVIVWEHEDDEPYEYGEIIDARTIYSKEVR